MLFSFSTSAWIIGLLLEQNYSHSYSWRDASATDALFVYTKGGWIGTGNMPR
jgi:hypothetical protein